MEDNFYKVVNLPLIVRRQSSNNHSNKVSSLLVPKTLLRVNNETFIKTNSRIKHNIENSCQAMLILNNHNKSLSKPVLISNRNSKSHNFNQSFHEGFLSLVCHKRINNNLNFCKLKESTKKKNTHKPLFSLTKLDDKPNDSKLFKLKQITSKEKAASFISI